MNPDPGMIDAFARAVDRLVFHERPAAAPEGQEAALALASYLNDSFPIVSLPLERRARVLRRLALRMGIPGGEPGAPWDWLEIELNRRLRTVDPRWARVGGAAALVALGLLGIAYLRQRSTVKPVPAAIR